MKREDLNTFWDWMLGLLFCVFVLFLLFWFITAGLSLFSFSFTVFSFLFDSIWVWNFSFPFICNGYGWRLCFYV